MATRIMRRYMQLVSHFWGECGANGAQRTKGSGLNNGTVSFTYTSLGWAKGQSALGEVSARTVGNLYNIASRWLRHALIHSKIHSGT